MYTDIDSIRTRSIRSRLEALPNLPVPVRRWLVKEGIDVSDEPAVWIWAYVEDDDIDIDADQRLKSMARQVVRDVTDDLWPFVLIRSANDPYDPDPET